MARQTRRAIATNPTKPLDSNTVANLQVAVLTARTHLDDLAHALVASHLPCLCGEGERLPGVEHNAHV